MQNRKAWFEGHSVDLEAGKQTAKEMIEKSGLDWKVRKSEIFHKVNGSVFESKDILGKFAVVREDTNEALGVVGNVYRPLQNTEAFSYFDAIVGTKEAKYVSAKSFDGGARVSLVAKLDGQIKVSDDDALEKYIILNNSHDGSSAVSIQLLALRLICSNGMLGFKSQGVHRVRHTLSMGMGIQNVRQSLGILNEQFDLIGELSRKMLRTPFYTSSMQEYLEQIGLIPAQDPEKAMSARAENIMADVLFKYKNGVGAVPNSLWGAYNAVTEHLDWAGTGNDKQTKSNLFGHGATVKTRALEYAQSV